MEGDDITVRVPVMDEDAAVRILRRVATACDLEGLDLEMTAAVFIGNSAEPLRRERLRKLLMEIVAGHRRHLSMGCPRPT
jgi:hypothetical protein